VKWAELEPSTRARARARTTYFPTRAGLAQDFSARVELELELLLKRADPGQAILAQD